MFSSIPSAFRTSFGMTICPLVSACRIFGYFFMGVSV